MKPPFQLNWWVWLLRGILLIAFGVFTLASPGVTAVTLALWFSIFLFIDGALMLIHTFRHWKDNDDKWLMLAEGVISIVLGVLLTIRPDVTLLYVALLLGFWFIYSGIVRIALAIQLRKEIEGEGWMIFGGALSVILGVILIARPDIAISSLLGLLAFFAIIAGILLIIVAFKIKKGKKFIHEKVADVKGAIDDIRSAT